MSKESSFYVMCDGLASHHATIYLVSCCGPRSSIKAMRAALCSNARVCFNLGGHMRLGRSLQNPQGCLGYGGDFSKLLTGYDCYTTRLGFDTWHLIAIARGAGFMPCFSEPAFHIALRDPRFTTPFLREWLPWIAEEMLFNRYGSISDSHNPCLVLMDGFQSCSALITGTDRDLDKIVSFGLREGRIRIPEKQEAA